MTRLDERLRRELERAARPADPTGVYEELIRRRERRRIVRRVEAGFVAFAVSVGSIVGIWVLVRGSEGGTVATPGPGDEIAALLYRSPFGQPPTDGGAWQPTSLELALISARDGSIRTLLSSRGEVSGDRILSTPSWSPDGSTLAFWRVPDRARADPPGLYTIDAEGGPPKLLLETELSIQDLAWSPDGTRVAFVGLEPTDGTELDWPTAIYTVAADGSGPVARLPIEGPIRDLAWSPDGSLLAITRLAPGGEGGLQARLITEDIYLVDPVDGSITRLTDDGRSSDPAWSPDGRQIAFTSSGETPLPGLFVMNADGSGRRRLTFPDGADASPTWSPDGRWIAVARSTLSPSGASGPIGGSSCQVVLVAADGSGERVLVDGPIDGACATELAWRPAPVATSPTDQVSEAPSPLPTTSPSTASPAPASPSPVPDLAAGCGLSAIQGDYDGDGVLDVAVVATLSADGSCPEPGKGETYLGIGFGQTEQDVGAGTFGADLAFGPLECGADVGCRVFAAPDLDGDGTAEIAVVQDAGASAEILGLYRMEICGPAQDCLTSSWISAIEVAEPGDPTLPLEPGPARILWGGSVVESYGAYCGPMEGDPPTDETGFVVWRASADAAGSGATVHEALLQLRGARLRVVATHDYEVPSTAAGLPPGGGSDLCGAPVAGPGGD